jgi:hypothetical protein
MNGSPVASARPSVWLAIPALPSCKTQATGDRSLGASCNPGASVGATKGIASVYASLLHTARMPLDYAMTVLPEVGPFTPEERIGVS